MVQQAVHDAAAAGLDALAEAAHVLFAGGHAALVVQALLEGVVATVGNVLLVVEQAFLGGAGAGAELLGVGLAGGGRLGLGLG